MNTPYIVEIIQMGDELGVIIPEEIADILNLQVGDDVSLELNMLGNAVIIKKKKDVLTTSYSSWVAWA
jgi:antitoxin component of MazEF toxin-antitoxin module